MLTSVNLVFFVSVLSQHSGTCIFSPTRHVRRRGHFSVFTCRRAAALGGRFHLLLFIIYAADSMNNERRVWEWRFPKYLGMRMSLPICSADASTTCQRSMASARANGKQDFYRQRSGPSSRSCVIRIFTSVILLCLYFFLCVCAEMRYSIEHLYIQN